MLEKAGDTMRDSKCFRCKSRRITYYENSWNECNHCSMKWKWKSSSLTDEERKKGYLQGLCGKAYDPYIGPPNPKDVARAVSWQRGFFEGQFSSGLVCKEAYNTGAFSTPVKEDTKISKIEGVRIGCKACHQLKQIAKNNRYFEIRYYYELENPHTPVWYYYGPTNLKYKAGTLEELLDKVMEDE